MALNVTFNEAIAELIAMQEQLQVSDPSVKATEMEDVDKDMVPEDTSKGQDQAENGTVNLSDLLSELYDQMILTLTTQYDSLHYNVENLEKLMSTTKTPDGLPGISAEVAAQRKPLLQVKIQNWFKSLDEVEKAVRKVGNAIIQCLEGNEKSMEGGSMMPLQLCHALEYFFACREKIIEDWEEMEAVVVGELKYWEGNQ